MYLSYTKDHGVCEEYLPLLGTFKANFLIDIDWKTNTLSHKNEIAI